MQTLIAVLNVEGKVCGTAAPVQHNLVLTCAHVLRDAGYPPTTGSAVSLQIQEKQIAGTLLPFPWIKVSGPSWPDNDSLPEVRDVVALRLSDGIGADPKLRELGAADGQSPMIALGFTKDILKGVEAPVLIGSLEDARGLRQLTKHSDGVPVDKGFSGGPVLDANRYTVGMIISRWRPPDNDRFSSPMGYMLPMSSISWLFRQFDQEFPKIPPYVFTNYSHVKRLADSTEAVLRRGPFGETRLLSSLLPLALIVAPQDSKHSEIFALIERVHNGEAAASDSWTRLTLNQFLTAAPRSLYVQAPGGSGKSFFLQNLLLEAPYAGIVPFYLSITAAGQKIKRVSAASTLNEKLEALFSSCSALNGTAQFERAAAKDKAIFVVDGLNETSDPEGVDGLIELASQVAANYDNVSVIVADRLSQRSRYPEIFQRASIAPLSDIEIKAALPGFPLEEEGTSSKAFLQILRVPFFLDIYRSDPRSVSTGKRAEMILRYVDRLLSDASNEGGDSDRGRQQSEARKQLAKVAYEAYSSYGVTVPLSALKALEKFWPELAPSKVTGSGLMRNNGSGELVFRHQLVHDALAASHFDSQKLTANPKDLETLTNKRQSIDALIFALELDHDRADELIKGVYDWDHAITLSCLVATRKGSNNDLAMAISAAVAEKLEDPFLHTRLRPKTQKWALQNFIGITGDFSPKLTVEHIKAQRERFAATDLYDWWRCFTAEEPTEDVWLALLGKDPLSGWSAAVALHRMNLGNSSAETLKWLRVGYFALRRRAQDYQPSPVRWRIVHVLGKIHGSTDLLTEILWDAKEHQDVRHGAARALMEIAVCDPDQDAAKSLIHEITAKIENLRFAKHQAPEDGALVRALAAFRRCSILNSERNQESPAWWNAVYAPLLTAGALLVKDIDAKEYVKWAAQIERFKSDTRETSE
jgi:hypothetical protein